MLTWRISMAVAGTLAPKCIETPSSGWMRRTSAFVPSSRVSVLVKGRCGARLNMSAISVTRRGMRLALRR